MPWPRTTRPEWFARDYPVTAAFLAAQVAVFLFAPGHGFGWGALARRPVWAGEWWRLVTPVLVHADLLHLAFNGLATFFLLPALEDRADRLRAAGVYLAAGLGGSLMSVLGQDVASVGASGAIFGVMGVLGAMAFHESGSWEAMTRHPLGHEMIVFTVGGLTLGLLSERVDNLGHLGGLMTGGALGEALANPRRGPLGRRLGVALVSALLAGATAAACFSVWSGDYHLVRAAQVPKEEALGRLQAGLRYAPRHPGLHARLAEIYWQRGNRWRALDHRVVALEEGLVTPGRSAAEDWVALARLAEELGRPDRAGALAARADSLKLDRETALAGLAILVEAGLPERAGLWARYLPRKHPDLALLCEAVAAGAGTAEARDRARAVLARPPAGLPAGLARWIESRSR